jgi:hypothetical protein
LQSRRGQREGRNEGEIYWLIVSQDQKYLYGADRLSSFREDSLNVSSKIRFLKQVGLFKHNLNISIYGDPNLQVASASRSSFFHFCCSCFAIGMDFLDLAFSLKADSALWCAVPLQSGQTPQGWLCPKH